MTRDLDAMLPLGVPLESLALYSRWWAFETWLRELIYIELRAMFGSAWAAKIDKTAGDRQAKDERHEYMVSGDSTNVLAYEDVGLLFKIVESQWSLFESALIAKSRWAAKAEELLAIRHRISHCRRPHPDDINRIEQAMRDLEPGAWRAITTYNRAYEVSDDLIDPVVEAWVREGCDDAKRLVRHAERQYDTSIAVQYSARPWAQRRSQSDPITGAVGYMWCIRFVLRGRYLNPLQVIREWGESWRMPECVAHVLADDPYMIRFMISALEEPDTVVGVIGQLFDSVLSCSTAGNWGESLGENFERWHAAVRQLDHRFQSESALAVLDDGMPKRGMLLTVEWD